MARRIPLPKNCSKVSGQWRHGVTAEALKLMMKRLRGIYYFSRRCGPPELQLTFHGRNIPFVNSVKYLGVITDTRIAYTWRLHIEMTDANHFRTFITVYSTFKASD
jgi:hypothetical protein